MIYEHPADQIKDLQDELKGTVAALAEAMGRTKKARKDYERAVRLAMLTQEQMIETQTELDSLRGARDRFNAGLLAALEQIAVLDDIDTENYIGQQIARAAIAKATGTETTDA